MDQCKPLSGGVIAAGYFTNQATFGAVVLAGAGGRGLHSSTFQLNVSTFCGIRWVHGFPPVY